MYKNSLLAIAGALGVAALLVVASFGATGALAASPTLFGGGTQATSSAMLTSDLSNGSATDDYSGITFDIPAPLTLSSLGELSAVYSMGSTNCGGGSPRFQIQVTEGTTTKNIFAYLGDQPNYNTCTSGSATSSGNLLMEGRSIDTSQLAGGTFYDTYSHLISAYGTSTVTGIQLVVDAGWALPGSVQTAEIMSATVGGDTYTFVASPATLEAPTLVSPASGSTLTSAQWSMADWSDVTGSSTPITYLYESSLSPATTTGGSFATPIFQSGVLTSSQISTAGTGEGTYYWHARAVDNSGTQSPWSSTFSVTVDNSATTTPPGGDAEVLIEELRDLQDQFPQFFWNLEWLINDLMDDGDPPPPPPPAGTPSIDNNGMSVRAGGTLDFVGRNFGREEDVRISLSGSTIRTVHADGGGNFSTGSMSTPSSAGTYNYVFTGLSSGLSATSTITVTP